MQIITIAYMHKTQTCLLNSCVYVVVLFEVLS